MHFADFNIKHKDLQSACVYLLYGCFPALFPKPIEYTEVSRTALRLQDYTAEEILKEWDFVDYLTRAEIFPKMEALRILQILEMILRKTHRKEWRSAANSSNKSVGTGAVAQGSRSFALDVRNLGR